jgi:hypothetical protein
MLAYDTTSVPPVSTTLVSRWARARSRLTPWAYPRLRVLGAVRLTVGTFLIILGALMLSNGLGWVAAIPLAGAALNLSIAYLDSAAARSADRRA